MSLTKADKLHALKALKVVYKNTLNEWFKTHNKKGAKYTVLMRPESVDGMGYTHLYEQEYTEPQRLPVSGRFPDVKDFLPFLTFKQYDKIFKDAGLAPVNWEWLATHWTAMDRAIDYINEDYRRRNGF